MVTVVYMFKQLITSFKDDSDEMYIDFSKINLTVFNDEILTIIESFKIVKSDSVMKVIENDRIRIGRYVDSKGIVLYHVNNLKSKNTYRGNMEEIKNQIVRKNEDMELVKHILCASISLKFK